MNARNAPHAVWLAVLTFAACGDPSDPARIGEPSFAVGGVGRPSVLVNPSSDDNGTAKTIRPMPMPFAKAPIAGTGATSC